ncbi:hypothetical protein [Bernardetia sp.]|uniref:hypothetical protein n=1 Tax=Bernardetia sp. TaxID=1937974 RepID=UPI0025BC7DB9|nr:hypothetical protein [Bernardetia sp.]
MKKHIFFKQKENVTFAALLGLIVLSFVLMYFQHNQNKLYYQETNSDETPVSKLNAKSFGEQDTSPHFLPAL